MGKLADYKKKRDFERTQEPSGKTSAKVSQKLRFVVQRHHASRLHYDFRLELDGVLKSWAVPKGPSLYPKDKRLAVQVEDHPIDYAVFEGIIPKGNYGAGVVSIFDSGYYDFVDCASAQEFLENLEKGSLKFKLHGHILKGEFALVRIKGDDDRSWLLIKHKDRYATEEPFNSEDKVNDKIKQAGLTFKDTKGKKAAVQKNHHDQKEKEAIPKPMLTKLVDQIPEGSDWIYEKKYDGFRIIAVRKGEEVQLYSRNGKNMNNLFPSLVEELRSFDKSMSLDGEIVIEDKSSEAYFQFLQSGEPIPSSLRLRYYVFDLLQLEGEDLTGYMLEERKELLSLLVKRMKKKKIVHLAQQIHGSAKTIQKLAETKRWEGIVAKSKESIYQEGKRNSLWAKFKLRQSQEAVICGYTKPQGNRSYFGALVLGVYKGNELRYIGNCGTGFDEKALKELYAQMEGLRTAAKPFSVGVTVAKEKDLTWIKPIIVCEVYYSEWTQDKHLRHPIFKGIRKDKDPQEVEIEKSMKEEENDVLITLGRKKIQLTNLNKVYWPEEGYIKGQMIAYYEQLAPHILPYIKNKPISLHRFPNGITKAGFFQKDVDTDKIPNWVKTNAIYSESTDKDVDYIICNDKATLLYITNLGSIEINPWLSTYQKQEYPEFAVLDLDPNGADFQEVIKVARTAHDIFVQMGIKPFLKTSGSTGLHIYIFLKQKYTFEIVRDFVEWIGQMVHERHPQTTSLVRDPKKRKELIYLDFLQNRRGQTVVAPYSLRPKAKATASAPLFWEELTPQLRIVDYTIKTMIQRIEKDEDPWKAIWDSPVNIKGAVSKF